MNMESKILENIGIDPFYIFVILFFIQIILFILLISANMKYNRLKASYSSFMKGKDGKNLEDSIFERFDMLEEISKMAKENRDNIKESLSAGLSSANTKLSGSIPISSADETCIRDSPISRLCSHTRCLPLLKHQNSF